MYLQWCLFFTRKWQQVTNLAVVMAHCGISTSRYGSLSKSDLFSNSLWICVIGGKYVSLIWSYIWQEVRKSTSFGGQCAHCLSSLEIQVCLLQPCSIARICSLSLYRVKAFLSFGQSQWSGILSMCSLCLGPNIILVCSVVLLILSNVSSNYSFVFS